MAPRLSLLALLVALPALLVALPVPGGGTGTAATAPAAPAVVGWDGRWLSTLRKEVAASAGIRPALRPALAELRATAESLLALEAPSVVGTGSVPLPGTGVRPNDLWYLATYAWPCGTHCNSRTTRATAAATTRRGCRGSSTTAMSSRRTSRTWQRQTRCPTR